MSELSRQGREIRRLQPRTYNVQSHRATCELTAFPQMTCARCGQHFCYRCGEKLHASNPYQHFSTPGHPCFSKLFDYQSIENEWEPIAGFEDL